MRVAFASLIEFGESGYLDNAEAVLPPAPSPEGRRQQKQSEGTASGSSASVGETALHPSDFDSVKEQCLQWAFSLLACVSRPENGLKNKAAREPSRGGSWPNHCAWCLEPDCVQCLKIQGSKFVYRVTESFVFQGTQDQGQRDHQQ